MIVYETFFSLALSCSIYSKISFRVPISAKEEPLSHQMSITSQGSTRINCFPSSVFSRFLFIDIVSQNQILPQVLCFISPNPRPIFRTLQYLTLQWMPSNHLVNRYALCDFLDHPLRVANSLHQQLLHLSMIANVVDCCRSKRRFVLSGVEQATHYLPLKCLNFVVQMPSTIHLILQTVVLKIRFFRSSVNNYQLR